jgi:DNA invertase Pin-like site-specific DNA recombinase
VRRVELIELGVGFISLTEALDLTTPTDRAMAGMLSVFAEFEREICIRIANYTELGRAISLRLR